MHRILTRNKAIFSQYILFVGSAFAEPTYFLFDMWA